MTYVITQACVGTKDASCTAVCPVDCIHPSPDEPAFSSVDQLFIDPEGCIDCDACVAECPVGAIMPASEVPDELRADVERNAQWFRDVAA